MRGTCHPHLGDRPCVCHKHEDGSVREAWLIILLKILSSLRSFSELCQPVPSDSSFEYCCCESQRQNTMHGALSWHCWFYIAYWIWRFLVCMYEGGERERETEKDRDRDKEQQLRLFINTFPWVFLISFLFPSDNFWFSYFLSTCLRPSIKLFTWDNVSLFNVVPAGFPLRLSRLLNLLRCVLPS